MGYHLAKKQYGMIEERKNPKGQQKQIITHLWLTSALGNLLTLSLVVVTGEIPSYHSYIYTAKGHPL